MTKYIVTGGVPLRGKITLRGAKNAGFKAMIAALLANSPSEISNLGLISEIEFARKVITSLGGKTRETDDPHCLVVDPRKLESFTVPQELGEKSRAVTMYVGPILRRFGRAILPVPGGDPISRRPIDRHIEGLTALGARVEFKDGVFRVEAPEGLVGARYRFKKNTHTGTETLLMCAVWAKGETFLENAAAEPEVDDLINFLNAMGVKITRVAPRTIKIIGVTRLEGAKHKVMADRNEAVTFGCMALATRGEVFVEGADPKVLEAFLEKIREIGGVGEVKNDGILFRFERPLKATDVATGPYPGFMTDWQPLWTALLTQAAGKSVVHETVFENRFHYVADLLRMGAKITLFNPEVPDPDNFYNFNIEDDDPKNKHAAKIVGPTKLMGTKVEIDDIRRGATTLLAGLAASGRTVILDRKDQIKRGYEDLVGRLVSLGARIEQEEMG